MSDLTDISVMDNAVNAAASHPMFADYDFSFSADEFKRTMTSTMINEHYKLSVKTKRRQPEILSQPVTMTLRLDPIGNHREALCRQTLPNAETYSQEEIEAIVNEFLRR